MSVVSLRSRLTADKTSFEAAEKSATSLVLATRPSATAAGETLSANGLEIELRVGDRWATSLGGDQPRFFGTDKEEVKVPPRSSIIVETLEYIAVPNNLLGVVFPKGSLFRETGLHPLTAKVDPTWRGNLRILLHNAGSKPITIKKGQPIASLSFFAMESTLGSRLDFPDDAVPLARRPRIKSALRVLQSPALLGVFASAFGAVAGSLVTVWLTAP